MARLVSSTAVAVVALGLVVTPAAFAQQGRPNTGAGVPPVAAAKDTVSQHDKEFVKTAAMGGMAEVEFSKIAETSANPEVKRFAMRMVQDHTAANTELTALATSLGLEVPKALDSEHERIRERLQREQSNAFDRQYMHVMVEDHNKAVKLFHQEVSSGRNAELKQFARKTLPTIEEHQKMAIGLSRRLSPTAAR
jgi:putative membrane protein